MSRPRSSLNAPRLADHQPRFHRRIRTRLVLRRAAEEWIQYTGPIGTQWKDLQLVSHMLTLVQAKVQSIAENVRIDQDACLGEIRQRAQNAEFVPEDCVAETVRMCMSSQRMRLRGARDDLNEAMGLLATVYDDAVEPSVKLLESWIHDSSNRVIDPAPPEGVIVASSDSEDDDVVEESSGVR